jgi:uncharacterized protein (TIGR02284 family)
LSRLYRVTEAGEQGFATAAISMVNPGLKAHLKSYAQRRALLRREILGEIRRLDPAYAPRSSIRGTVHRGAIVLLSGMTIEDNLRERMVLKEAIRGETFALGEYDRVLQTSLPSGFLEVLERHRDEISEIRDELALLAGLDGKRLWVRLFSDEKDALKALRQMNLTGVDRGSVERARLGEALHIYDGKSNMVAEAIAAGGFFGLVWGILFAGLVAVGLAILNSVTALTPLTLLEDIIFVLLALVFVHAVIGSLAGLILGAGAMEEDTYQYQKALEPPAVILRAVADNEAVVEI